MTIQISVLLWTVICFVILMLVLDRLLFRPMLAFMDKRRAKIEGAREARKSAESAAVLALKRAEEARAAAGRLQEEKVKAALDEARRAAEQRARVSEQEYAARLESTRTELNMKGLEIRQRLETGTDELVRAFVEKLAPRL